MSIDFLQMVADGTQAATYIAEGFAGVVNALNAIDPGYNQRQFQMVQSAGTSPPVQGYPTPVYPTYPQQYPAYPQYQNPTYPQMTQPMWDGGYQVNWGNVQIPDIPGITNHNYGCNGFVNGVNNPYNPNKGW